MCFRFFDIPVIDFGWNVNFNRKMINKNLINLTGLDFRNYVRVFVIMYVVKITQLRSFNEMPNHASLPTLLPFLLFFIMI